MKVESVLTWIYIVIYKKIHQSKFFKRKRVWKFTFDVILLIDELFRTILFIHRDKMANTEESKISLLLYCYPRKSSSFVSLLPPFHRIYFQLSTYRSLVLKRSLAGRVLSPFQTAFLTISISRSIQ